MLFRYNLGQMVGEKLTKFSKIDFSMEWLTADFLQFFTKKCQNLDGWVLAIKSKDFKDFLEIS